MISCKCCGGELEKKDELVGVCTYCGAEQPIPKVQDENIQNLLNRANRLRLNKEFDKAIECYEKILTLNDKEAEVYWGLILSEYGIEYVEDPATLERIPTCHRTVLEAVVANENYKMAMEYSDLVQRRLYENEAKKIDELQKKILEIVRNEKPYDVFICYKQSDDGTRTVDSAIANDIYHQLTQEGYKVFYAEISLEDKIGKEYEPYIYSALSTAKVMLVLGTKPEYFNAVWVKNEWSRFFQMMKKDRSKLLIPCYRDMDAYDLPSEFAHLQSQDMGKIGFLQDVIRGIKKVVAKEEDNQNTGSKQDNSDDFFIYFYESQIKTVKDKRERFLLHKQAAERGYAKAQNGLGWYYQNGIGTEKNEREAFVWYQKAAEQGHASAQNNLAHFYANGIGTEKNEREAVVWYQKAAEQGHVIAQTNLAYFYEKGIGTEKNEREAFLWLQKAAEQGQVAAQTNLARCYRDGIGTEKNEREAFVWFQKAAKQGHTAAQFNLAYCYENGIGTEKNEREAFLWLQKSAEQGHAVAQNNLGNYYFMGIGTEKNEREAFLWLQKSAEQGYAVAQNQLGLCYGNGIGTEKNEREAFVWHQKAAEQGNADAQNNLGYCYKNGIGTEKNMSLAIEWYKKAAFAGYVDAQLNLGHIYQNGIGVGKDAEMALMWYQKAANQGNEQAREAIKKMEESASQNTSESEVRFCSNCGAPKNYEGAFCMMCGSRF